MNRITTFSLALALAASMLSTGCHRRDDTATGTTTSSMPADSSSPSMASSGPSMSSSSPSMGAMSPASGASQ